MTTANDVIALLESLNKEQLEEVLRRTLKAIVQLEYRELMTENEELTETVINLETQESQMRDAFSEVRDFLKDVESWRDDFPIRPDISDFV